jgi:hypothetical protein
MTGVKARTPLPPMKEETKIVWCDIVLSMATVECGLTPKQQELMAPHIEIAWRLLNP